jgi:hypothetical protein
LAPPGRVTIATHDYRSTTQVRLPTDFHGSDELVEVDVQHPCRCNRYADGWIGFWH